MAGNEDSYTMCINYKISQISVGKINRLVHKHFSDSCLVWCLSWCVQVFFICFSLFVYNMVKVQTQASDTVICYQISNCETEKKLFMNNYMR